MGEDRTGRPETTKPGVTVSEASALLGITAEAVRMRIKRGTLPAERRAGRVYVLLGSERTSNQTTERTADHVDHAGHAYPQAEAELRRHVDPLTEELRDRLRFVEGQLEAERQAHAEARRLLAAALERIPPQLEPPQEPRESPTAATEQPGRVEPQPQMEGAQRPWWRRVFGG